MLTETFKSRNGRRVATIEKNTLAKGYKLTLTETKRWSSSTRTKATDTKAEAVVLAKSWVS
jgi:hypothetical protein